MKEIKKNPSMTYEEVLQNPSLIHFHEAIHLLQNRSHNDIFPQHYELSMLDVAETHVVKLWRKNPEMSLKMVVTKVMAHFLDNLSAESVDNIELQRDIVKAYQKVGDIQGASDTGNIGKTNEALQSYQKAFAIQEKVVANNSANVEEVER